MELHWKYCTVNYSRWAEKSVLEAKKVVTIKWLFNTISTLSNSFLVWICQQKSVHFVSIPATALIIN